MKQLQVYLTTVFITVLMGFGATSASREAASKSDEVVPIDYREECTNEGCRTEEVRELYESYKEECLNEGCSWEEVRELGGSKAGAEDMLEAFKRHGWKVTASDFNPHCHSFRLGDVSLEEPSTQGTMNCKVVFFFTTKCKGLADDGHRHNWTETGASGVPKSRSLCW